VAIVTWDELLQGEELAYRTEIVARRADVVPIPDGLHPRVIDSLAGLGLDGLYRHQAEAFLAAERGEHLVVSTGTASGKTLAFNLPVLNALAEEPKLRALYLYPTKALAQDQARALAAFKLPRLRPAIYDGDTETERRWQIRKWANVILTNPDMLHVGVLPHHDRWGDTSTAVSSARTSRMSCAGFAARPRSTEPSRSSFSHRLPSPTRASSSSRSSASGQP
jgi:DEAD/DEAH box helicase domain-containing protein